MAGVAGVKTLAAFESGMSKTGSATRLALVIGALVVVHYLATGKLPFGTPELLRSDEASEGIIDE